MTRVYVAGAGFTRVADHWRKSLVDLAVEAGFQALSVSNSIQPRLVVVGNMLSSISSRQEHLGALMADSLGLGGIPAYKVEAAGASGGMAVNLGYTSVKSGEVDAVLVIGVEKMRDLEPGEVAQALTMAENSEFTQFVGVTSVALNAMLARLYMNEYGVTREELSAFPVLAHHNALSAEHAQFRKAITYEDVAKSMTVSDPLRLLDCAPVGDGAAAILLIGEDKVGDVKNGLVEVLSSAVVTNRFNLYEREDMLDFTATGEATQKALSAAHIGLHDLDFIEIHDAFSVTAALTVEAMKLSRRGEGARDAKMGRYSFEGEMPSHTFGGLKGRGNPVGATGVYQIAEAYLQLTGKAGANQVKDARLGLTHNVGGVDTTSVVNILRRVEG